MKEKLAGFSYIYNGVKFDIPFEESVESVIDVVDQFVLTECFSEDDTWERCLKLQAKYPTKLKLAREEWVTHFTEISRLANWTILQIDKDINYVFELQSDEIVHEKHLEELRLLPERMKSEGKNAARWNYLHFLGNPETIFSFCYSDLVRVAKRRSGWNIVGDGVQFSVGEHNIPENDVLTTNIEVYHYGKMKDPNKAWDKEWAFQQLFKDIGFPDPRMKEMQEKLGENFCDYVYLFENNIKDKKVWKFTGTHPVTMHDRIAQFKGNGWEQFESKMKEGLKLL